MTHRISIKAQATLARLAGLKSFKGTPCPYGHTRRFALNGSCLICKRMTFRHAKEAGRILRESPERQKLRLDGFTLDVAIRSYLRKLRRDLGNLY
jgi:hypothetical protein